MACLHDLFFTLTSKSLCSHILQIKSLVNLRLQTQAGEEILYVGDHLYSDVLRSKRTLGWRTTLIVPELTNEMAVFRANREIFYQIIQLRKLRDDMSSYADSLKRLVPWTAETEQRLLNLHQDDLKVKEVLTALTERYHRAFHPVCEFVMRFLSLCFFYLFPYAHFLNDIISFIIGMGSNVRGWVSRLQIRLLRGELCMFVYVQSNEFRSQGFARAGFPYNC
jgi:hypothetical protein